MSSSIARAAPEPVDEGYRFVATKTMSQFMQSPAYVRVLAGPIGGGKSVACAHTLMQWAIGQAPNAAGVRRTRFLVVRNTVDQLRSTTLKTIVDWFPPSVFGDYRATEKVLTYRLSLGDGTRVETEWMLVSLETPDDVRKALGLECTGLWGNECRELHPEVVDGLLMRVNRFPSKKDGGVTRAGAIFDTNMPGEETWWESKMTDPPENWSVHVQPPAVLPLDEWISKFKRDPKPEITAKSADGDVFAVDPTADNVKNLEPDYYPMTLSGKAADFISVYLRCRYGRTLSGLPVYDKTFQAHKHVSKVPLEVIRSDQYPLCIGLDFGRTPAAVIGQLTPRGRVNILSELTSENMGIQTFVQTLLKPHLFAKYPGMPHYLACDPAGWQKTQLGEISPVDYLESAGFTLVPKGLITNNPKRRIEAVEALLAQSADGEPRLSIDSGCRKLLIGFRGGYKWAVTRTGELADAATPIKNGYSHCVVWGTRVSTPSGPVPIQEMCVGDLVLTRRGARRVTATMSRTVVDTVELTFDNGRTLRCTGDHPIIAEGRRIRADALQYSHVLAGEDISWREPGVISRCLSRLRSMRSRLATLWRHRASTSLESGICTELYGHTTTVLFQPSTQCTTSTTTKQTTPSGISSALRSGITHDTTRKSVFGKAIQRFYAGSRLREQRQRRGISPQKGVYGTRSTHCESPRSSEVREQSISARGVVRRIWRTIGTSLAGSALCRVKEWLGLLRASTTSRGFALSVEASSRPTSTDTRKRAVRLVRSRHLPGRVRVYDLTVADEHEFYAEGVLVGNCHDAMQYLSLAIDGGHLGARKSGRRQVKVASSGGWT